MQTIGPAGESVAAGVVVTIPALLFMSDGRQQFEYFKILVLAIILWRFASSRQLNAL